MLAKKIDELTQVCADYKKFEQMKKLFSIESLDQLDEELIFTSFYTKTIMARTTGDIQSLLLKNYQKERTSDNNQKKEL